MHKPSPSDKEAFRHVIGHFTSGVAVISCTTAGGLVGMTASAVSSVSLEPPMLLICLNRESATQRAVHQQGAFAVNVLHEDQGALAERFASAGLAEKFEGVPLTYGSLGQPLLEDALANLECRVAGEVIGGTHRVFVAHVVHAIASPGAPLAYFRGEFGRLLRAQELDVFSELRARILSGGIAAGEQLALADVAASFNAPPAAAYYALARLAVERLVTKDGLGGYRVVVGDSATIGASLDARLAIELGVAALVADTVTSEQLGELRRRQRDLEYLVSGEYGIDPRHLNAADGAFHEYLVSLARNEALLHSYVELSVAPSTRVSEEDARVMIDHHRRIVDGLASGSADVVRRTLIAHRDHGRHVLGLPL